MTPDQTEQIFAFADLTRVRLSIHGERVVAEGGSDELNLFSRYLYKMAERWDCFFRCFNAGPYRRDWFRESGA